MDLPRIARGRITLLLALLAQPIYV